MIDALYRGEVNPCKVDYRSDSNYSRAMADIVSAEDTLMKQLDELGEKTLSQLTDAYARLGTVMTERAFHDGVCLAIKLIFDVLRSQE